METKIKKTRVIGFTGEMGSGKSTAAQIIVNNNPRAKIFKFAQPLYDIQEYIYKRTHLPLKKDRVLLQWIGSEWGREIDPNLWTGIWFEEVATYLAEHPENVVVCDDIRFDNEASIIKSLGGVIIELHTFENRIQKINSTHVSERGISRHNIDRTIDNNRSLEELENAILYVTTT